MNKDLEKAIQEDNKWLIDDGELEEDGAWIIYILCIMLIAFFAGVIYELF